MAKTDQKSNESMDKISDALKLLDEAAAEKRDEVANLISEKYHHLRDTLGEVRPVIQRAADNVIAFAAEAKEKGAQRVDEAVRQIDRSAHDHPWGYVAAAGIGGLVLGLLFSRKE